MEDFPLKLPNLSETQYSFIDSKSNKEIQICDWIVGILSRTFDFLRNTNQNEIAIFYKSLNETQEKNIYLLEELINSSKNKEFIDMRDGFVIE
ncbi:MAG: hypothetical protein FWG64_11920 [Firmicutes bacterium]|nr:hypothetical protein [Bacillota bacterium]